MDMNPKNYIISQRVSYLGIGALVGYALSFNEKPLDMYMVFGFIVLCFILSYWLSRK